MKVEGKSRPAVAPMMTLTQAHCTYVLEVIRARTVEEGDCLLWLGGCSRGQGSSRPQPALWLDGQTKPLRRLAYVAYGKELFAHWRVSTMCGNDKCLCEEHLRRKSHSESLMGHHKSPVTIARIAAAKQAASALDWDKIREIRSSDMHQNDIAVVMGVHPDTIGKIRTHQTWRETSTPFSGLGAR